MTCVLKAEHLKSYKNQIFRFLFLELFKFKIKENFGTLTQQYIHVFVLSWPENQGILFFYISKTLEMIRISFMASLLNAVL